MSQGIHIPGSDRWDTPEATRGQDRRLHNDVRMFEAINKSPQRFHNHEESHYTRAFSLFFHIWIKNILSVKTLCLNRHWNIISRSKIGKATKRSYWQPDCLVKILLPVSLSTLGAFSMIVKTMRFIYSSDDVVVELEAAAEERDWCQLTWTRPLVTCPSLRIFCLLMCPCCYILETLDATWRMERRKRQL